MMALPFRPSFLGLSFGAHTNSHSLADFVNSDKGTASMVDHIKAEAKRLKPLEPLPKELVIMILTMATKLANKRFYKIKI